MKLYSAQTSQAIDRDAIENHGIPGILLMKRAAWFAFDVLEQHIIAKLPANSGMTKQLLIVCGTGNNGGDGFMLAQYAKIHGFNVTVALLGEPAKIKNDARIAFEEMQQCGLSAEAFDIKQIHEADVIIDAIFGTGLNKNISDHYEIAIKAINQSHKPVLAIDIPSGVNADCGALWGQAVQATHTCTFITQKLGLYTAQGQEHSGKIHFSNLHLDKPIYKKHAPIARHHTLKFWLNKRPSRSASHHKGKAGTSGLIGGNYTMMGAIQLAGLASLKSGSGLIKIITQAEHAIGITQALPELMCYSQSKLSTVLNQVNAIGIGPGLGEDSWAQTLFDEAIHSTQPKVIDADALKLLKPRVEHIKLKNWVLTPHPGEAAMLLDWSTQQIQNNRVAAIKALHSLFGGVIVLKGNGSLIYDGQNLEICTAGNAGMAVGGMGDVLTGAITSFLAQGLSLWDAANLGVSAHAHAGDIMAQQNGQPGLTPSEVAQTIGQLLAYGCHPPASH